MLPNDILKIVRLVRICYLLYECYLLYLKIRKRRWWVRELNKSREEFGFYEKCFKDLKVKDTEHFFKATRLTTEKFDMLCDLLKDRLQKYSRRKPIQPEERLALTLIFLAHGCSIQVLAWSFKMGVSTARQIIYETCEAIWEELGTIYVSTPNEYEWKKIADEFWEKNKMPNCVGAVDGKHINIVCPKNSGSSFYNYKKNYSIVLLASCDTNYTFTLVDIGANGSQSDGGVFFRSSFGRQIVNANFPLPQTNTLPNHVESFPYYFVGDAAFPLKKNLMRPYPGKNLSSIKENFNKRLSKARVLTENSFGILANRWRILRNTIHCSPTNVDKIVLATIVLHNFLMLNKDEAYFSNTLVDHEENGVVVPGQWRVEGTTLQSSISSISTIDQKMVLVDGYNYEQLRKFIKVPKILTAKFWSMVSILFRPCYISFSSADHNTALNGIIVISDMLIVWCLVR